jgi:hypothetical protein
VIPELSNGRGVDRVEGSEGLEGAEVGELGNNEFGPGQAGNWAGLDMSARSLPGLKLASRVP